MAQQVKLRRSSVAGNKPTTTQLELGELAINTNDGKLYFEKSSSLGESIQEIIVTDAWNTGSINISGSVTISGSITATSFTGSLLGTASYARQALSSSYANNATSASYALTSTSASFATTASYANIATSASYSATSSYANNFTVAGTLTAQTLIVQTVTSSIIYASGSNQLGDATNDTQLLIGTTKITGSLQVTGSSNLSGSLNVSNGITGSLLGTASYASNALSASYATQALSASYAPSALSSSYAVTSSFATTASYASTVPGSGVAGNISGNATNITAFTIDQDLGVSDQVSFGGVTASFLGNLTGTASYATNALSASYSLTSTSASYALSASYAATSTSASYALTASYAATASSAQNASDILVYVKNSSGAQINKGKVVRIVGAVGDNPLIATASYQDDNNSANTLGITYQNIPNDDFGYVITEGTLLGVNTNAFTAGQLIYLGATGSIIGTAPVAPLHAVRLGEVLRVQLNNGSIYVRVDNGYELGELHDVKDTSTTSSYGDLLVKSGSVWINSKQLSGSYGLTGSLNATSFTGSLLGTSSYATQALNATTASYVATASYVPTLQQVTNQGNITTTAITSSGLYVSGSATISGNLNVLGTASFAVVTSSVVIVGDSTIVLSTDLPAVRFGGIEVVDSGSFGNSSTGSLLWDSLNNRWIYSNPSGSTYDGGMLISGPRNTSGLGNEVGTTNNAILKGQGGDHLTSSAIIENGTSTNFYSSAAIITSAGSVTATSFTGSLSGSLLGTASYATQALSASYALNTTSASYALNATSASYALTSTSASYATQALSASYVRNAVTASYYSGSLFAPGSTTQILYNNAGTVAGDSGLVYSGSNVGIGVTNPGKKLDVVGTGETSIRVRDTGGASLEFYQQTTGSYLLATSTIILYTSGSERMRIMPAGNVGIGTTNPTNKLEVIGSTRISGSTTITGSVTATSFTGSLLGTASYASNALSASYALNTTSASYALTSTSASFANNATTASYALTSTSASYANNATSASYALTSTSASFATNATSAATASYANNFTVAGTLTAQTLVVQTITSSIIYSSGSNQFGDSTSDTQLLIGTSKVTGSLQVTGSADITGSLTAVLGRFTSADDASLSSTTHAFQAGLTSGLNIIIDNNEIIARDNGTSSSLNLNTDGGQVILGNNQVAAADLIIRTGSLGINTSSPSFSLHVVNSAAGDSTFNKGILVESTNSTIGEAAVAFKMSGSGANYWLTGLNQSDNYAIAYGSSFTNPNTLMFISSSGNIGLGTATPSSKLYINNGSIYAKLTSSLNSLTLESPTIPQIRLLKTGLLSWYIGDTQLDGSNNFSIGTDSGGNIRPFSITTAGYVLLNTTSSTGEQLQVNGTSKFVGTTTITGSLRVSAGITGSLFGTSSYATQALSASYALTSTSASFATNAVSASYVNTLNQNVLITGSATIGAASVGASENTLTLGARDTVNEGGQLGFNAPGGTWTSASFLDNWSNQFRILRGSNTTSDATVTSWNLHTKQMQLPAYTSATSFVGTATANLAVDSSGNIITVSTTGGTVFPYTGNAVITGSLTTTQAIYSQVNGGMYFQGGDDAALYDINVVNTMGIYGVQDSTVGSIKLGSGGGVISGKSSRIGIGTTNPTNGTLEVSGNVYATSFTGSLFGTASYARVAATASYFSGSLTAPGSTTQILYNNGGTVAGDSGLVYSGSRVGIGTATPANNLHIYGTGDQFIKIENSGTYLMYAGLVSNEGYIGSTNATPLGFYTNGSNRMYINTSGNVGIGTISPSDKLEVVASTYNGITITTPDVTTLKMRSSGGGTKNWGFATTNLAASDFGIYESTSAGGDPINAGTARLYFKTGGTVGIGTTNTTQYSSLFPAQLVVNAGSAVDGIFSTTNDSSAAELVLFKKNPTNGFGSLLIQHSGSSGRAIELNYGVNMSTGVGGTTSYFVNTNGSGYYAGNVGIGTTNPAATLDIKGNLIVSSSLIANQNTASLGSGAQTISTNATSSYTAAFFNYTVASGSNARAGQVTAVWNGGSIQYTDVSTTDIGSTSGVAFTASLSGANVRLTTVLPTSGWTVKTLANLL